MPTRIQDINDLFATGDYRSLRNIPFQTLVLSAGGVFTATFELLPNQYMYVETGTIHVMQVTQIGNSVLIRNDLVGIKFRIHSQDAIDIINIFPTATVPPSTEMPLFCMINTSSNLSVSGGTNDNFRFNGTGEFAIYRIIGPGGRFQVQLDAGSGINGEYAVGGILQGYLING
jgi:hypothetical protein